MRALSTPGFPEPLMKDIDTKVRSLPVPKFTGEPMIVEFLFGLWGGTGSLKILETKW
jgi:hypothetical protein